LLKKFFLGAGFGREISRVDGELVELPWSIT